MNTCETIESVEAVELETVTVQNENIVELPLGLLGFEQIKRYALLQNLKEAGDWQDVERKLLKSWWPTSTAAASAIAPTSSATGTCQSWPRSSAGGARRLMMR